MKWRLVAVFIGVILMVLIAQDVPLASHLRRVETERLLAGLERDAFLIGGTAENLLSGEGVTSLVTDVQSSIEAYATREGARVVITDRTGLAVAVSDDEGRVGTSFSTRPEIVTALDGAPTSGRRYSNDLAGEIVFVAVPVLSGAEVVGAVRITFPAAVIDDRANDKVRGLLAVGIISMIAAAIAALFMAGTVVRPLRRLQRSTEAVAAGDFSSPVVTNEGPPEVRRLAESFNTMTSRVADLVESQRSFADDASHQLRTPLTALRVQLERAQQLVESDPMTARERIEAAGAETERLQRLIDGLLMLARSNRREADASVVDIAAIARERVEIWQPLAEEQGVTLSIRAPSTSSVRAVDGAIEQIIDNYLDNALSVSPPGSEIAVTIEAALQAVELHVIDEGPGMTASQLTHAFDRFWRAADAPHDGSGLGLAIVRHLATASDGEVSLASRPTGGLDACLRLRAAAPPPGATAPRA